MSETAPLLASADTQIHSTGYQWKKKHKVCCWVLIVACVTLCILLIIGMVPLVTEYTLHTDAECLSPTPSPTSTYSRSGSYSLLSIITDQDLVCNKPSLHISLESRNSMMTIYQTQCLSITIKPFHTHYTFTYLLNIEAPRPLFDENFSPHNYFLNGSIQLDIINITDSTLSSVADTELCLFSDSYEYDDFLRAGTRWKDHVSNANCSTLKTVSATTYTVTFNISKPTFAFVGMASTSTLQASQINITATGREISSIEKNSSKICQLNGRVTDCSIDLPANDITDQSIRSCIVAYEEGNPDGSYDYSNLTISFPNQVILDHPYQKMLIIYGSISLGVILMSGMIVLIGITILLRIRKRHLHGQSRIKECSVQSDQVTHESDDEDLTQHHKTDARQQSLMSFYGSNRQHQLT